MQCSKCNGSIELKDQKVDGMYCNYWWCDDCGKTDPTDGCVLPSAWTWTRHISLDSEGKIPETEWGPGGRLQWKRD